MEGQTVASALRANITVLLRNGVKFMLRIRTRLFLTFILLIGLSVFAAGLLSGKMIQDAHIQAKRSNMIDEVNMIISMTDPHMNRQDERAATEYYQAEADRYAQLTNSRITFIRRDGVVLGDSHEQWSDMDNHRDRPEIRSVLEGKMFGAAIRFSDTTERNMMYVALPVFRDQQLEGYVRMAIDLDTLNSAVISLWTYLLLGLSVLLLLSALVSYRFALRFTKPIEHIIEVANKISRRNYRARVRLKNRDELGMLGEAIDTMAGSLQEQMEQILESENRLKSVIANMISGIVVLGRDDKIVLMNKAAERMLGIPADQAVGIAYDRLKPPLPFEQLVFDCIYKREHMRDEIVLHEPEEKTIDIHIIPLGQDTPNNAGIVIVLHDITAIRKLERMRSEFVANVSHELKTPISAVKGFAETLLSGSVEDKATVQSFIQIIYDESERLNRLLGDILELSKIETKKEPLHFAPIQMDALLHSVVEMMRPQANQKRIDLTLETPRDIYIEGDEDRLRQVFINLLSNGINYTPENGSVKMRLTTAGGEDGEYDRVIVSVSDTGIGIPKKDLPRIFERFYRVDKARSRSSGGTGLGLSIVKHLVELHHGTIQVKSELGVGSTFSVELPVIQS